MTSATDGGGLFIVERILRDREGIWRQISERRGLGVLLRQMLVSSLMSLACYGAVLGSSKGWEQALSSTVKLPVLFLATLAICLPTLYLFNLVFGARLMMSQAVSLIMVCITVTSVLTLAFAPISLFFRITAQNYQFFKLLNITILVLTAVVGLRFLTAGMRALNDHNEAAALAEQAAAAASTAAMQATAVSAAPAGQPAVAQPGAEALAAVSANGAGDAAAPSEVATAAQQPVPPTQPMPPAKPLLFTPGAPPAQPVPLAPPFALPTAMHQAGRAHPNRQLAASLHPERQRSMTLLYVWILLFGFVGTQLAWTLRPFFGSPGEPFEIFRNIEGTFYGDVFRTIGHLLGG